MPHELGFLLEVSGIVKQELSPKQLDFLMNILMMDEQRATAHHLSILLI
jgi:hypothetical protein